MVRSRARGRGCDPVAVDRVWEVLAGVRCVRFLQGARGGVRGPGLPVGLAEAAPSGGVLRRRAQPRPRHVPQAGDRPGRQAVRRGRSGPSTSAPPARTGPWDARPGAPGGAAGGPARDQGHQRRRHPTRTSPKDSRTPRCAISPSGRRVRPVAERLVLVGAFDSLYADQAGPARPGVTCWPGSPSSTARPPQIRCPSTWRTTASPAWSRPANCASLTRPSGWRQAGDPRLRPQRARARLLPQPARRPRRGPLHRPAAAPPRFDDPGRGREGGHADAGRPLRPADRLRHPRQRPAWSTWPSSTRPSSAARTNCSAPGCSSFAAASARPARRPRARAPTPSTPKTAGTSATWNASAPPAA